MSDAEIGTFLGRFGVVQGLTFMSINMRGSNSQD